MLPKRVRALRKEKEGQALSLMRFVCATLQKCAFVLTLLNSKSKLSSGEGNQRNNLTSDPWVRLNSQRAYSD